MAKVTSIIGIYFVSFSLYEIHETVQIMKPGQKICSMDMKIVSKICRKLPCRQILIDCKLLIF